MYSYILSFFVLKSNIFQTSQQIQKKASTINKMLKKWTQEKNIHTLKLDTKLQLNQTYYDGTKTYYLTQLKTT